MNIQVFCYVLIMLTNMQAITNESEILIEDFNSEQSLSWRIINDGVMGGISQSRLVAKTDGNGWFSGRVSLENYGGFASVRAPLENINLKGTNKIVVRVKGDGKRYSFRIRTDRYFDGLSYSASFDTEEGQWELIELPYSSFIPTFRGRRMRAEPIEGSQIRQIGFLISDKQEGPFELAIDWIIAN